MTAPVDDPQSDYPPPTYSGTSRAGEDGRLIPDNVADLDPSWADSLGWQGQRNLSDSGSGS